MLASHGPALTEVALYPEFGIARITWIEVLVGAPDPANQLQWEAFLNFLD